MFNLLHVKKWNTCPKRKKERYVTAPDHTGDEEKSHLSGGNEEENEVEGAPKVNLCIFQIYEWRGQFNDGKSAAGVIRCWSDQCPLLPRNSTVTRNFIDGNLASKEFTRTKLPPLPFKLPNFRVTLPD